MSHTLTLAAFGPPGATPAGGLLAWIASVWKQLRATLSSPTATKDERELIHLIEFAGSRFGDPILQATDEDALDDQLDELLVSPDVMHLVALAGQMALSMPAASVASWEPLTVAFARALGAEPTRELNDASALLEAWLAAQRDVISLIPADALEAVQDLQWTDPRLPAEIAEAGVHGVRMSLCILAVVRALTFERSVTPWLARALIHRIVESARIHLRLLASLPGVSVAEDVIPKSERLDLTAIEDRHTRARATALRSLEGARARLPG